MPRTRKKPKGLPVRRGALSNADKDYILRFREKKSPAEIAAKLRRAEPQITRFMKEITPEGGEPPALPSNLHERHEWKLLEQQFDEEELAYFTTRYDALVNQFGQDDILPTEETQLFELITVEIMASQALSERRTLVTQQKYVQRCLDNLYEEAQMRREELKNRPATKPTAEDKERSNLIADLEARFASLSDQLKNINVRQQSYTTQKGKLLSDLKGTRDQRIKTLESSKQSFLGHIKALMNEDYRRAEGSEIGLLQEAIKKERGRLSKPHTYIDGSVDQPLLTPETVLEDHEDE